MKYPRNRRSEEYHRAVTLGQRIRLRRLALGIGRAELADELGCGANQIWAWDTGEYAPHRGRHHALARALDWNVRDLRANSTNSPHSFERTIAQEHRHITAPASSLIMRAPGQDDHLLNEPAIAGATADRLIGLRAR